MDAIVAAKTEADAAFRCKDFPTASAAYTRALDLCQHQPDPPHLLSLYSNRSAARLGLQDFQGALADAQASLAIDESWVKGHFRSAKALQGLGKLQLAIQAALRAQQLEPNNQEVKQLLQQLREQQQQEQQEAAAAAAQTQQQQQHVQTQQPQAHQQQQQPSPVMPLPWRELNKQRSQLDLSKLPKELVSGSRYIPSPDGINHNLLLLLHGLGDKPAAFTALAQRMALPQTACLALSGPQVVPETDGGRAWFTAFDDCGELIQPTTGNSRRSDSLAATLQLLCRLLLKVLPAVGGWRLPEVQLLGFSQGGCVALELVRACQLRHRQQLGGVVAISAGLLEETLMQQGSSGGSGAQHVGTSSSSHSSSHSSSSTKAADSTPVLITYGDRDDVVPRSRVDRSVVLLEAAGCPVQLSVQRGKGHGMISSEAEMRVCMQFWAKHLKHRPADPDFVEMG